MNKKTNAIVIGAVTAISAFFVLSQSDSSNLQGKFTSEKTIKIQPKDTLIKDKNTNYFKDTVDTGSKIPEGNKIGEKEITITPPPVGGLPPDTPVFNFDCAFPPQLFNQEIFADEADVFFQSDSGTTDHFGYIVRPAGDFNNDGFNDMLVGDERFVYMFYGPLCQDKVDSPDVVFKNPENEFHENRNQGSYFKEPNQIGDFNGDGIDDIAVGAYVYPDADLDPRESRHGAVFVYFGSEDFDDQEVTANEADHIFYGEAPGDFAGTSVVGVGDVNNDGFDDMAIGAKEHNLYTGAVYIVLGSNTNWKREENLSEASVKILTGEQNQFYRTGRDIRAGGDLNNDGIDDFIISQLDQRNVPENTKEIGSVIVYGREQWPTLMTFDDENMGLISTEGPGLYSLKATGLGDLNGDGSNDILITDVAENRADFRTSGMATILYGPFAAGILDVDLLETDTILAQNNVRDFGKALEGLGDINGDNLGDFMLTGEFFEESSQERIKKAFVFLGSRNFNAASSSDADLIVSEYQWGDYLESITTLGDTNGDGINDFAIGLKQFDRLGNTTAGAVSIFMGRN